MSALELWGGHECTVNRVGEAFYDQTLRSGHHDRIEDLDRFAELGLNRLRYPVLWERVAPESANQLDFSWSDARLARLGELGVKPIVGLVHHGGGPAYTHLLDDSFAPGLAAFARRVAERYPHVEDWTPVNEPLTTARFSCLYGHWYPHLAEEGAFWRALLNQVDAVRLAMHEIRRVNPAARLIQTEDIGRTYATAPLQYQADYDNARRWMTWDLLFGRVVDGHRLHARLCAYGLGPRLEAIANAPCAPDVLGLNHYLTSDRFLDHRLSEYPLVAQGGNLDRAYADVEAVRVMSPPPPGLEGVLREATDRYGRSLAITECHNGCTREEQMRWFAEAWDTAEKLRTEGLPIEAVTAWSLLGSYDWNSLLTVQQGSYEPGVFDLGGPAPRATGMAKLLANLVSGTERPPAAHGAGWWRRDVRLEHPPVGACEPFVSRAGSRGASHRARPILITGATGTLGRAVARACEARGLDYVLTSRAELDLGCEEMVEQALSRHRPWAVVNAAGWVRVDDAEQAAEACLAANAEGAGRLARASARYEASFVGFSSALVFDGVLGRPYSEADVPSPLSVYGASKARAEELVLSVDQTLMIRTSAFFSAHDPHNFAWAVREQLKSGRTVMAADDLVVTPTYVPDLVRATLDLLIDDASGLWHLANRGETSWADFARRLARAFDLPVDLIEGAPAAHFAWPAARPACSALVSERGLMMPTVDDAVKRMARSLA
ncbi:dTDP-4-dehydrorhamnose reductase [Phenylobacterium sp. Root77]|jgi:dTDP-4-dehydrorhamnose reductase|uniref:family 1 glycosylhydrolase n=1 Tax=unclassified Phenylobacterium TaxID=2640670 RepID=UPI0006F364C2|nr:MULTISPECIES: family 1 glycosylhydrolase [unclassified Phenylobacterium]KQW67017.1 dTDP-4-dehydrorhamnose reductase [Phenylobacterium sp. Root1277]KQW89710.1 dTDP-4-dehydrorhamnose reductase [Phenylobacterium sp. Root1290]KRC43422.1 dTDP-4-dehydrorhamnose reductase [Phenylobacterium sp. Root77]